jgi:hypothetical protein
MEPSDRANEWKCDSQTTKLVIPACLTKLTWNSFRCATNVTEIIFEAGSQIRELDFHLLSACELLKSICIPASVEVISLGTVNCELDCWARCQLERVTFEAGSRLREIQRLSFSHLKSLKSICLPASVQLMDGGSFVLSSFTEISVENGNPFFRANGPFLMDFKEVQIVRYFGSGSKVTIPCEIETLGSFSFSSCPISAIQFAQTSKLSLIECESFSFCHELQSISIPSSVRILRGRCFSDCHLLKAVLFERDSQLVSIGNMAFLRCWRLNSVILPSNLEIIGESCFFKGKNLKAVTFASDSTLVRIEKLAFEHCCSLQPLFLPPLLEFVGENCFYGSSSLSRLTFASPSSLRELLDLPLLSTDFQAIPDSVEVLQMCRSCFVPHFCALTFGNESRLRAVRTNELHEIDPGIRWFQPSLLEVRYFVRVSSRSLKIIRSNLEFDGF